jgi:lysozyme family protein
MAVVFDTALEHVLSFEGGYVDHPSDPGGATNMGITIGTLAEWRGTPVTKSDVENLTLQEAGQIYKDRYWDVCRCGEMPDGIAFMLFDAAVNHGPHRAKRFLQQAAGVADDGIIGPQTMGAVNAADPDALVEEYAARRMHFYGQLSTFSVFGMGWSRRLMSAYALSLPKPVAAPHYNAPPPFDTSDLPDNSANGAWV